MCSAKCSVYKHIYVIDRSINSSGILGTELLQQLYNLARSHSPQVRSFRDTVYHVVLKEYNGCDTSYYRMIA